MYTLVSFHSLEHRFAMIESFRSVCSSVATTTQQCGKVTIRSQYKLLIRRIVTTKRQITRTDTRGIMNHTKVERCWGHCCLLLYLSGFGRL